MKIVKCDGLLDVGPEQLAYLQTLNADFQDLTLLTEDALIEQAHDADALMILREPVTERVLAHMPRLKVIGRFGVGLDSIDVAACRRAGVQVTYVPDSNLDEVSTHALAMTLALVRRLPRYDAAVRAGRWDAMGDGAGIERTGAMTFGLLGFGNIGRMAARKAAAFGFRLQAYDPFCADAVFAEAGVTRVDLETAIATSDVLSLHLPVTPQTRNIVSAQALAAMKPGAILINVSRGGLVDEAALAQALIQGHLAGAGLDTLAQEPPPADHPLLHAPNVLLSPHAAHYSRQSYAEVRNKVFADVAAVLQGRAPAYPVPQRD